MKISLTKKIGLVIIIIGIVAAGIYAVKPRAAAKPATAVEQIPAKVEEGPIRLTVSSTGRVVPNLNVDIKCKASGEIITLPYDISDTVTKGALLVELDPVDEQRRVKRAEVELAASQARLEQARLNLAIAERNLAIEKERAETALKSAEARARDTRAKADRLKQLLEKNLASQEEYDTAETAAIQAAAELRNAQLRLEDLKTQEIALNLKREDVRLAEAAVESDKINLELARQQLKDTKVYAPMDGVVTARNVQTGQIISSGISNVGGGTTIMTLSDLSRIYILAAVDESDIGKVEVGQPVMITVDAYPNQQFFGKVVRIATKGVSTSNVVTFEVKIEVLGRNKHLLKPEMTANVEIIAGEREKALLVPVEAVSRKMGKMIAQVLKPDKTIEEREIQVGISDGVNQEVLSGLSPGETVLVRKGEVESRWRSGSGTQQRRPMPFGGMMMPPGAGRRSGR